MINWKISNKSVLVDENKKKILFLEVFSHNKEILFSCRCCSNDEYTKLILNILTDIILCQQQILKNSTDKIILTLSKIVKQKVIH
jgi:hypothetical protein